VVVPSFARTINITRGHGAYLKGRLISCGPGNSLVGSQLLGPSSFKGAAPLVLHSTRSVVLRCRRPGKQTIAKGLV